MKSSRTQEYIRLRLAGKSVREIGKMFGVTHQAVSFAVVKHYGFIPKSKQVRPIVKEITCAECGTTKGLTQSEATVFSLRRKTVKIFFCSTEHRKSWAVKNPREKQSKEERLLSLRKRARKQYKILISTPEGRAKIKAYNHRWLSSEAGKEWRRKNYLKLDNPEYKKKQRERLAKYSKTDKYKKWHRDYARARYLKKKGLNK